MRDLKAVACRRAMRVTESVRSIQSTLHTRLYIYCERPPRIHPIHCPANVPGRKNVRYATSSPADRPPTSAENTIYVRNRATGDRLRSAPPGIEEFLNRHVESQRALFDLFFFTYGCIATLQMA